MTHGQKYPPVRHEPFDGAARRMAALPADPRGEVPLVHPPHPQRAPGAGGVHLRRRGGARRPGPVGPGRAVPADPHHLVHPAHRHGRDLRPGPDPPGRGRDGPGVAGLLERGGQVRPRPAVPHRRPVPGPPVGPERGGLRRGPVPDRQDGLRLHPGHAGRAQQRRHAASSRRARRPRAHRGGAEALLRQQPGVSALL